MSSAGSSQSSKLSQFGLYRAIDSRTEEFLRLSRRRQIRQGCACAAVSTAITVTVVITVLLVYEFTIHLDSSLNQKQENNNWFSMTNTSLTVKSKPREYDFLDYNIPDKKLSVITNTFNNKQLVSKKAIKRKVISSTLNPVDDNKTTTDTAFEKLFFAKINPTQYTDLKSSPSAVNLKNHLNNIDYFRKLRHIKNYQRMLNYFDKMINNPLTLMPSTRSLINPQSMTEPTIYGLTTEKQSHIQNMLKKETKSSNKLQIYPLLSNINALTKIEKKTHKNTRTPESKMTNILYLRTVPSETKTEQTPSTTERVQNLTICECNNRLLNLLSNLTTNIQKLIPELNHFKTTCFQNNFQKSDNKTKIDDSSSNSISNNSINFKSVLNYMITKRNPETTTNSPKLRENMKTFQVNNSESDSTLRTMDLFIPKENNNSSWSSTFKYLKQSTTTKKYEEVTTSEENTDYFTTESMKNLTLDLNLDEIMPAFNGGFDLNLTLHQYSTPSPEELSQIYASSLLDIYNLTKLVDEEKLKTDKTEKYPEISKYSTTTQTVTTSTTEQSSSSYSTTSTTQRMTTKANYNQTTAAIHNVTENQITYVGGGGGGYEELNVLDDFDFNKNIKLIYSQSYPVWTESEDEAEQKKSIEVESLSTKNRKTTSSKSPLLQFFETTTATAVTKNQTRSDSTLRVVRTDETRPVVMDYDEFQFLNEEQKEQSDNTVTFESMGIKFDKYDTSPKKSTGMEDSTSYVKSMLPVGRPIYLEVHRNDWKHENDYGNMDNTFDLL